MYINDDLFSGTYRRNWEGDYHCSRVEVLAMLRDEPEATMDMKMLPELSLKDLDMETLRSYRNRHMAYRSGHPWENLSDAEYLEKIGAAVLSREDGAYHPTAAGLLMFGEEYRIVREFPEYFLDYRELLDPTIRWTDRLQSSSGDWTGNLFDFYFRVYNKLAKDVKVPFQLSGITRIDDTPVHQALREALANCLVNADFYISRGIVIRKDATAIVMENPGYVRVGKRQMLRGGISDPRNKALMKMFNLIGIGDRAGSGVPDIFAVWKKQGWDEPRIEEEFGEASRTILTLPLISKKTAIKNGDKKTAIKSGDKKRSKKTEENLNAILVLMELGKSYKATEIAEKIGLQASRTRELLAILAESGRIELLGNGKRDRRYRKI